MLFSKLAEERIEVVGGGGEVEERWHLKQFCEMSVELWHSWNGVRVFHYEGAVENTKWGGSHGDFDGVVYV